MAFCISKSKLNEFRDHLRWRVLDVFTPVKFNRLRDVVTKLGEKSKRNPKVNTLQIEDARNWWKACKIENTNIA